MCNKMKIQVYNGNFDWVIEFEDLCELIIHIWKHENNIWNKDMIFFVYYIKYIEERESRF